MDSNQQLFKLIFTSDMNNCIRSFETYLPINNMTRQVYLTPGLKDACERGFNFLNAQLFYMDYLNKVNVFLGVYISGGQFNIPLQNIVNNSIQIGYRQNLMPSGEMIQQKNEQVENNCYSIKNKKVKQRTIKQAIQAVQLWRSYYDTPDSETGRRLYTLDQAAKKVGIAKKTLDDYYNHLRIAQQYDFNLQRFIDGKIGILRKFVKKAKQGGKQALQEQMRQYIVQTNIEIYWNKFNQM